MKNPFVSICIPAYNNETLMKRLLDSIHFQTYNNYEIIISDDSRDDRVEQMLNAYGSMLKIRYVRNDKALGSPENWNNAIRLAQGEWIKIMHHDDYFTSAHSLSSFVSKISSDVDFLFSNYYNFYEIENRKKLFVFPSNKLKILQNNPMILNAENILGNPSCTLIHEKWKHIAYDVRFIWKVDIEYYINLIASGAKIKHLNEGLVTVGINESQITNAVKLNPNYEIPEAYYMLEKHGFEALNNLWVYDGYWRMFRNMNIYTLEELYQYKQANWGVNIAHLLKGLNATNKTALSNGFYSKFMMLLSFITRPAHAR